MTQRRIACLLAEGFEDSEFAVPTKALRDAGFEVDIVGVNAGQQLQGKAHKESTTTTRGIADCSVVDYLGVLVPGGKSPTALCQDKRFVDFMREFGSSGKPIAAICHGPQLLIAAGLVKGRKMTAYKTVQQELSDAGAKVVDEAVASDGTMITSRTPEDIPKFVEAILAQFKTNASQSWMARGDIQTEERHDAHR